MPSFMSDCEKYFVKHHEKGLSGMTEDLTESSSNV